MNPMQSGSSFKLKAKSMQATVKEEEADLIRTRALLIQAEQRIEKEGYSKLSIEDIKQAALNKKG